MNYKWRNPGFKGGFFTWKLLHKKYFLCLYNYNGKNPWFKFVTSKLLQKNICLEYLLIMMGEILDIGDDSLPWNYYRKKSVWSKVKFVTSIN